jgi:hypothetical protein
VGVLRMPSPPWICHSSPPYTVTAMDLPPQSSIHFRHHGFVNAHPEHRRLRPQFLCHPSPPLPPLCSSAVDAFVRGDGAPTGADSPRGGGDGEKCPPESGDGDGGGENFALQGRGWVADPRRGCPCCHPYLRTSRRLPRRPL